MKTEEPREKIERFHWRRARLPAAYAAAVMAVFVMIWLIVVILLLKCS